MFMCGSIGNDGRDAWLSLSKKTPHLEAMNHLDNPFAAALLDELKIIAGTAPAPPSAPTQVRVQVEDTIVGTVRDPSVVL